MKGVKTATIFQYHFEEKFGESIEVFKIKTINKYDSNGNKVEKSNYEKGSLMVETFYKYDSDGNMVEESKRDLKGKFEWKYDSNGNMVEELYNKTDGQSSPKVIFINKYDTKNRIIEVISYPKRFDEFKRPTKKTIYEYEEY